MYEENDIVLLKEAHPGVYLPVGATGWVITTYIDGVNALEAIFDREERGEIQLLLTFDEIELVEQGRHF